MACSLGASACVKFVTVDGKQLYQSEWDTVRADLGPRAAFDLKCGVGDLQYSMLKGYGHGLTMTVYSPIEQVGVRGCGQQAVYVNLEDKGWVMNSTNAK
ncbi:MAG: hypothetical protein ABJE95_00780 [Byssovorax sp.]